MSTLFTPLTVGPLTLTNRIVVPPMSQYSAASDGIATPWHAQHIGGLAISGAGLVICEANGVTPDGRITPHCLGLWNDEQAQALKNCWRIFAPTAPRQLACSLTMRGARRAPIRRGVIRALHCLTKRAAGRRSRPPPFLTNPAGACRKNSTKRA